ncbi:MAG: histidine kinase, partial [Haloplasmataceae bacterium]|nr:histidine kinase [Haloplasmataceae bacterium]
MKVIKYLIASFLAVLLLSLVLYFDNTINFSIVLVITIINFLIHFIIYQHYHNLYLEFNHLNDTVESILNGQLDARMIPVHYEKNRELRANINRLAKRMEKMTFKKEEDEQTIKILTNNITSPIIYVDIDGRIRYVNNQFINQFQVSVEINEIYETIRNKQLYKFIDDSFIWENNQIISLQMNEHYYQANAIPINNNQIKFMGILFIFHDITDIKKYEKLQREFLADTSHELKTPISAIKGAAEILLNGGTHSSEIVNEFLNIIRSENNRMSRIVSDILLISKIESDNLIINTRKINLKDLLRESTEIMRLKLDEKNQTLVEDINDDLYIEGDYERLKQVFLNLVTNAINYTNEYKNIYISSYTVNN